MPDPRVPSPPPGGPPAKPSSPRPGKVIARVLLIVGLVLMLYVVVVIGRALG